MGITKKQSIKPLTPKQEQFCLEYLIDLNATQAAIRAGYSKKTAKDIACQNLAKLNISTRIAELMEERGKRTRMDGDAVVQRLSDEIMADVADLFDDNGNLLPVKQWPLLWRQGLVAGLDITREKDTTVEKLKISDRVKRIELLGRHFKLFTDRVEGNVVVNVGIKDYGRGKRPTPE